MTCRIIAELSCNHSGSIDRALQLVDAVAAAGAHGVKLQTWKPGTMVLDRSLVLRDGPWVGHNLTELYDKAHTPWEWHKPIFDHARMRGIEAFSSAFDRESVRFLESIGCPRYKVASFEMVDLQLIRACAATKKPVIISTGMATKEEIAFAVEAAHEAGAKDVTLLKCTSAYPADGSSANLATMRSMASTFSVKVGLSDHTPGVGVAIAAAALGAEMIEKHFTLWRAEGGLDANFSIEASELKTLVEEARRVEKAMGEAHHYGPTEHERPQLELRRSLYFAADLPPGTFLGDEHIASARPARGISPRFARRVLGAKLLVGVHRGQPVSWEVLAPRQPAGVA
jgi:N-acetylneuraminate synthase